MKPKELLNGLENLAKSLPLTATAFKVPTVPSFTPNSFRTVVTARDILDLVEYVKHLEHKDAVVELKDFNL